MTHLKIGEPGSHPCPEVYLRMRWNSRNYSKFIRFEFKMTVIDRSRSFYRPVLHDTLLNVSGLISNKYVKELGIFVYCLRCHLNTRTLPRKHFRMPVCVFVCLDLNTDDTIDETHQT